MKQVIEWKIFALREIHRLRNSISHVEYYGVEILYKLLSLNITHIWEQVQQ